LSQITGKIINEYDLKLVEPGCSPGSGRWGVLITLQEDISAVFPYLNAEFGHTIYDHQNKNLVVRDRNQAYAFRPEEIQIARADDSTHARQITAELVEKINRVWRERDRITPYFKDKRPVAVIDIFKLLPRTNCRKCGYLTCLAYAADLRQGTATLENCPHLAQPDYAENRQKIAGLFVVE
jgi:ArsR family metal-binding transcriptional regulator